MQPESEIKSLINVLQQMQNNKHIKSMLKCTTLCLKKSPHL